MEEPQTSIMWKTSNRRATWNKIWDSQVVVKQVWGTFGPVAFKDILDIFWVIRCTCDFSENTYSKTLPFLQIAAEIYQTVSELSSQQGSLQNYRLRFLEF